TMACERRHMAKSSLGDRMLGVSSKLVVKRLRRLQVLGRQIRATTRIIPAGSKRKVWPPKIGVFQAFFATSNPPGSAFGTPIAPPPSAPCHTTFGPAPWLDLPQMAVR